MPKGSRRFARRAADKILLGDQFENRELVIELKNLKAISEEGENAVLELMNERVKFRCGLFTKHILRQLPVEHRKA